MSERRHSPRDIQEGQAIYNDIQAARILDAARYTDPYTYMRTQEQVLGVRFPESAYGEVSPASRPRSDSSDMYEQE